MAWLAWLNATAAMKIAKTGSPISRPISRNPGGALSRTPPPPGWRRPRAATPSRHTTIHQSAMPVPVRAISAPTTRFAARKPTEPRPRAWP